MDLLSREEWKRRKRMKQRLTAGAILGTAGILFLLLVVLLVQSILGLTKDPKGSGGSGKPAAAGAATTPTDENTESGKSEGDKRDLLDGVEIKQMFLTPNEYSRPQDPLKEITAVAIHYVGNPGTTAESNRNYFNRLADTHETSASSHFVIGLDGEIIQCIPLDEIAYATKQANHYSISIECCHPDSDGKFNEATYQSLIKLTAWLCDTYDLDRDDILRHYDVTQKECPLYYVKNPDAWEQLRDDVIAYLDGTLEF